MSFGAHTIKPAKGSKRTSKRVGRGKGSGRGTYAGRGLKGQRARSGGKSGTALIGLKQSIKKIPKLRGFTSPNKKAATVTLATLEQKCEDGATVTPSTLERAGVIKSAAAGVKIVATGELKKKLNIVGCNASEGATKAIEAAGGTITQK